MKVHFPISLKMLFLPIMVLLCDVSFGQCSITVQPINVTCNGNCNGSAIANTVTGNSPYTYLWSNGVTASKYSTIAGLCPGTYTVTMTDAKSCSSTATASISQPLPVKVSVSVLKNINCFGACNGI